MTIRTRRTVFYLLCGLFLVLGAAAVLYAQGLRFDFAKWRFENVGAILVRSFPKNASISIQGKPVKNQSGLLSQSTLITGLLPGNYDVSLSEPGYRDWKETAEVLPSLVTEFKYAVLVPQEPSYVSTTSVRKFFAAQEKMITQNENSDIIFRDATIGRGSLISGSSDLTSIIFQAANGSYWRHDVNAATTTDLSAALTRNGVNVKTIYAPMIDPYDANSVIVKNNSSIWIFRIAQARATLVATTTANFFVSQPLASSPALLAWSEWKKSSDASMIAIYDKSSHAIRKSSSTIPGKTIELDWLNGSLLGALQDDGSLYIYDDSRQTFQKLADEVRQFAVSEDNSAVATLERNSFEIFPLANPQTYRRFNLPDVAHITKIIWYGDASHIFLTYPNSVAFMDIADLSLRNLITVEEGTNPLYDPQKNALYLINSSQKLERFDFPQ